MRLVVDREAALLQRMKAPEIADLPDVAYRAIVDEARRIARHEHYRRQAENGIAEARAAIEQGTFPWLAIDLGGTSGVWERTNERNPVVIAWAIDVCEDPAGVARLDALHELMRKERGPGQVAWNRISAWSVNGALRSWSVGGICENVGPRQWRLTALGRELLGVVFDA